MLSSNHEAIIVLIDGTDLSGKTAVAKSFLARNPKWDARKDTLLKINPFYRIADQLLRDPKYDAEFLGNLYVVALRYDIVNHRHPRKNTLHESTVLLRSYAYHSVRGTPRLAETLEELAHQHPRFDHTFILTASIEERQRRLKERESKKDRVSVEDALVYRDPRTFLKRENALIDLATRHFSPKVIRTDGLTISEVTTEIESHVSVRSKIRS